MFVTLCQQRTSTVPKNRGICGIAVLKSTVKATVLVPWKMVPRCRGSTVVPRNTTAYTYFLPSCCVCITHLYYSWAEERFYSRGGQGQLLPKIYKYAYTKMAPIGASGGRGGQAPLALHFLSLWYYFSVCISSFRHFPLMHFWSV